MKNNFRFLTLIPLLLLILLIAGCDSDNEKRVIKDITVSTSESNPDNIWQISWPSGYCSQFNSSHMFEAPGELTEADTEFIFDFVNSIPDENDNASGSTYLADITIYYATDDGMKAPYQCIYKQIFNDYPEKYDVFAEIMNRICGGDKKYLSMNKDIQKITPEYFTYRTNITAEEIPEGTIQDFIDYLELDMLTLNRESPYVLSEKAHNFPLLPLLPYTPESVASTDAEAADYARKLAVRLGCDGSVEITKAKAPYEDCEYYTFTSDLFSKIRIYRTEDMNSSFRVEDTGTFGQLRIIEAETDPSDDLQGHGLYEFIYSSDKKFAVAVRLSNSKDFFKKLLTLAKAVT